MPSGEKRREKMETNMKNQNVENALQYEFYDRNAGEKFIKMAKDGLVSAFIYSRNVLSLGEVKRYDDERSSVRTVAKGGEVFVPTLFFTKFLDAKLSLCRGRYTLKSKELKHSFKIGDGGSFCDDGCVYVRFLEAARALGFCANVFYDGRLAVVGSADILDEIALDEELAEAGAYLVLGKYDASVFSPEDYKLAEINWRKKLVGSPEINDMSNPIIKAKVDAISAKCKEKWDSMNKNPDRTILWGNHVPTESNELWNQYQGLCFMAKGYGTFGSEFYMNEALSADIVDGMRWMYENMYGEAEIAGTGWRDAHLFNWWYWFIAAPEFITDIFFIMPESFTMEEKKKYLKCFDWVSTFMRRGIRRDSALSRICVCTKVAIALCDPKRLYEEFVDFDLLLGLGETEEGPRVDYTQWTHGFPMNVGYGQLNLDRVVYTASALAGTPLEFSSPKMYNQFNVCKYMFEPAIYKTQAMMMLHGRSTAGSEMAAGASLFSYMFALIGMFGKDEDDYIKHMIKRNLTTDVAIDILKRESSMQGCTVLEEILADDKISAENDYEYAHAWFTGDRAAQHRNDYAIGIAMSSHREFAYECINGENKTGWHTGDGSTYLYTNYDNYQHDGRNFLAKNINVAYRFPGTTEDSQERAIRSISSAYTWHPSNTFAGSISFEDKYLTAAMDFEAYHFEGPELDVKDGGYGGPLPVHFDDLVAKKAWFCFDDEILALGAGINSSMNSPVRTTVEHRRIVGDQTRNQLVKANGEISVLDKKPYEKRYTGADYVLMEDHAGYVMLENCELHVGRYKCEEADSQDFFEVRVEHGENPKDQTYAYAIIPYATKEKLDEYSSCPDVEILSNTAAIQAVREKTLGISSYVFYESGRLNGVECDSSAIVMLKEKDGVVDLSVTDPTHLLKEITVILDRSLELVEKNPKMTVTATDGKTVVKINTDLANGRPFRAKFNIKQ